MIAPTLDETRRQLLADERTLLGELRDWLVRLGDAEEPRGALVSSLAQLDQPFLLVVVGEFNSGKSAVINALLGQRVLEEGVIPTTTQIYQIRYGKAPEKTVLGNGQTVLTFPIEFLSEMTIVDTPGTNAIIRKHETITAHFVPRSDLVLLVTSADRTFTESERAFLEHIQDWGKKVVFLINKID